MNLRQIANNLTSTINPNCEVIIKKYVSCETLPSVKTNITYEEVPATAQVQPADSYKLQHINGYSQGSVYKAFYLNGDWTGTNKVKGGDFIVVGSETYEIIEQPEGWNLTAGWTKVIGVKQ